MKLDAIETRNQTSGEVTGFENYKKKITCSHSVEYVYVFFGCRLFIQIQSYLEM